MGDCWICCCGFDRTYVGAGRRCRRASVQTNVLPLPRHWAGRQNQNRPTALMGRRNEANRQEGKKQESRWTWQLQRLSYLMRVDWTAQSYLNRTKIIQRIC